MEKLICFKPLNDIGCRYDRQRERDSNELFYVIACLDLFGKPMKKQYKFIEWGSLLYHTFVFILPRQVTGSITACNKVPEKHSALPPENFTTANGRPFPQGSEWEQRTRSLALPMLYWLSQLSSGYVHKIPQARWPQRTFIFLQFGSLQVWDQGASVVRSWRASSYPTDRCITRQSYGGSSSNPIRLGPHRMTSFDLYHLVPSPVSEYSHIRVRAYQTNFGEEETIHELKEQKYSA